MGYALIVLGLIQFQPRARRSALLLGAALVAAGLVDVLDEDTGLRRPLVLLTWPLMLAALIACFLDGSLARTYLGRGRGDAGADDGHRRSGPPSS